MFLFIYSSSIPISYAVTSLDNVSRFYKILVKHTLSRSCFSEAIFVFDMSVLVT